MIKKDIVSDTQVVVLMGGLGTRLGLKNKPKSMADVNGKPFFDYELLLLKRFGFHKFLSNPAKIEKIWKKKLFVDIKTLKWYTINTFGNWCHFLYI